MSRLKGSLNLKTKDRAKYKEIGILDTKLKTKIQTSNPYIEMNASLYDLITTCLQSSQFKKKCILYSWLMKIRVNSNSIA